MAAGAALVAMWLWPLRMRMRLIRWGIVIGLGIAQLFMKVPVWFLIAHVSVFAGSDSWHRAFLIDRAIANFFDWWLIGTRSTEAWGYSLKDVTNQYVLEGVNGGLITLTLFVTIIVRCYRGVGVTIRRMEGSPFPAQLAVWALGAALLAHTVTYVSVSYFDQNFVNWYFLLAVISAVSHLPKEAPQLHGLAATPQMSPYLGAPLAPAMLRLKRPC
jgi:hypothetical protein